MVWVRKLLKVNHSEMDVDAELRSYVASYPLLKRGATLRIDFYHGGLADIMKFTLLMVDRCMAMGIRFRLTMRPQVPVYRFLKLRFPEMMVLDFDMDEPYTSIGNLDELRYLEEGSEVTIMPYPMYSHFGDGEAHVRAMLGLRIPGRLLFELSPEVVVLGDSIIAERLGGVGYVGLHVRMGDRFLEMPQREIVALNDVRVWDQRDVVDALSGPWGGEHVLICCDNRGLRDSLELDFPHARSSGLEVGHVSYPSTAPSVARSAVVEFYLLSRARCIAYASVSGFAVMAAQFSGIPCERIGNVGVCVC